MYNITPSLFTYASSLYVDGGKGTGYENLTIAKPSGMCT